MHESPSHVPPAHWTQREEHGSDLAIVAIRNFSLFVGRRISRLLLPFLALYFTLSSPRARAASRGFLARCLGRRAGVTDVFRNILAFASTVHDRFFLFRGRLDVFDVQVQGAEFLHAQVTKGVGAFVFGAHLGSFEILRASSRAQPGIRVCMAMYMENARRINRALAAIHPGAMVDIIELGQIDSMLKVHQRLEEGAIVGVLADRAVGPDETLSLPFLGAPARFPTGPFRMAILLRRPVYFVAGLYRGGNRYETHVELLHEFEPGTPAPGLASLMERYVRALERHCRSAPYNWFNFFDFWEAPRTTAD
jgi:predicted LPLAT superfamily acyltransferase